MPTFATAVCLARPVAEVFAFFLRPANHLLLVPPEVHVQLVHAPEQLYLGARTTLQVRRWGLRRRVVREVTAFQADALLTDEQREGPFRRWVHQRRFEAWTADGTRLTDTVEFEPPGGLLGLTLTTGFLLRDLEELFAYQATQLFDRLARSAGDGEDGPVAGAPG